MARTSALAKSGATQACRFRGACSPNMSTQQRKFGEENEKVCSSYLGAGACGVRILRRSIHRAFRLPGRHARPPLNPRGSEMKYIPAGLLAVVAFLFFLVSLGNHQVDGKPATIMVIPASVFGVLGRIACAVIGCPAPAPPTGCGWNSSAASITPWSTAGPAAYAPASNARSKGWGGTPPSKPLKPASGRAVSARQRKSRSG